MYIFRGAEAMELNKLPLNLIPIASERVFMRQDQDQRQIFPTLKMFFFHFHFLQVRLQRAPEGWKDHQQREDRGGLAQYHLLLGEWRQV